MDKSDQRWSTINSQLSLEEKALLHWFASINWGSCAPTKAEFVEMHQSQTGVDCEQMLNKLIAEGRFGLVYDEHVYLNALLND